MLRYFLLILTFFLFFSSAFSQATVKDKLLDSIVLLRKLSKDESLDYQQSKDFALKAISLSKKYGKDSTVLKSKKRLSYIYLTNSKYEKTKSINFENLKLATKLGDSFAIANANQILGYIYDEEVKNDSAYYYYFKAVNTYKRLKKNKEASEVLLNMAIIQNDERDYIGAEINAIDSKKLLSGIPEIDYNLETLWSIHNLIGIIYGKLKLYDKALEYNDEAYKYADKMTKEYNYGYYYKLSTAASIASIYRKKGDYSIAIDKYSEILENGNLLAYDSSFYASTISNRAHSKFLNGIRSENEIEKPYREAIKISKAVDNHVTEIYTYFYLSKYFESVKRKDSAKTYINKSYKIAKSYKLNDFLLETLVFNASLKKDSSSYFLNEHIQLNDSLVSAERSIRNKFAIIDYETDVIIQEKEAISKQNLWLLITSIGLMFSIVLLYVIKTQRERNKEFQLAQQQQEANEEIYNLMLSQQDKMDEARAVEKKRISQEIHDGILGRLFGTRLSLDSLNMVNTEEAIVSRENYINDLMEIEKDIRKVSHDLNADFITHASFSDMINSLVETQCNAYKLEYKTKIDQKIIWENLTNKTKIHIYRIVQESLQNIYKHAQAKLVNVTLQQKNNLISLCIIDDGVGYDKSKRKEGIGLKNIKSRVEAINGKLNIDSKINEGTTIKIEIPI